jgi:hypothetical protein
MRRNILLKELRKMSDEELDILSGSNISATTQDRIIRIRTRRFLDTQNAKEASR